jgi:PAS domain S-box-containing protein
VSLERLIYYLVIVMKGDRIKLLLILSILLTIITAVIVHVTLLSSRDRVNWVYHTYNVINKSTELLSLLTQEETSTRGYLITQDSSYLTDFNQAATSIAANIQAISKLVSDNPIQTRHFNDQVIPLINSRLVLLREALEMNNREGQDSAFHFVGIGLGKVTMEKLQYELELFNDHEKKLLSQRLGAVDQTTNHQIVIQYFGATIIVAISALALGRIVQKRKVNNELLRQLKMSNLELDKRVKERTLELEEKNRLTQNLNSKLSESLEEVQAFYDALQIKFGKTEDALNDIRDLYDNALCGYHSLSPDGVFIRINNTELAWLGYTREEILGKKKVSELLVPDELEKFHRDYKTFVEKGLIRNQRHHFIRKDGTTFPIVINATAIYDDAGKYVMSRAAVIDITEIKQIEEKLITANNNLLQLNEEKNSLMSIVAHDLKSPLSGIIGLLSIIKYTDKNLNEEQKEYLRHMEQSCISMQSMIVNLLDVERIEKGLSAMIPEPLDIIVLCENILKPLKQQAARKDISLVFEKPEENLILATDKNSFGRILENLLSNALKFSNAGSRVCLRITNHSSVVKIDVIDEGPGIREEDMPRLFGKYQKLSARPTGGESSSGLGLSIVRELVRALDGEISVESAEGKGATFTLKFTASKT